MEIKQIQQFVALSETCNFRKAAEKLHISQPPLSISIRKLEEELELVLFERNTRNVSLTDAGRQLLPEFRNILLDVQRAYEQAQQLAQGRRGQLTIGAVASATASLIPQIIPAFRAKFPDIHLRLFEHSSSIILEKVIAGELDVGLIRFPFFEPGKVRSIMLQWDHMIAVLPENDPFISPDTTKINLRQFQSYPLINYNASEGLHQAVMATCQQVGYQPVSTHLTTTIYGAISLAVCGLGITLVPNFYASRPVPGVRYMEIENLNTERQIGLTLIYNKDKETSISRSFREHTVNLFANNG